jgi:hypothetical protein
MHFLLPSAAGGARKRPLMPNLAELLEEDEEGACGAGADGAAASRKSDGAALLRASERASVGSGLTAAVGGGSPPHKYLKQGERQWRVADGNVLGCVHGLGDPVMQHQEQHVNLRAVFLRYPNAAAPQRVCPLPPPPCCRERGGR